MNQIRMLVAVMLVAGMALLLGACGELTNATVQDQVQPAESPAQTPEEEETPEETEAPKPYTETLAFDAAAPAGNTAVVFAANFGDPIGSIATIALADPLTAITARTTTDGTDVVLRSFGGRIYAINRFGADTVQVIDPATFHVIADYSVGSSSNPQDIVVISDAKAYLTRLDAQNDAANTDDVLILNPLTGEVLGGFDLTPFTADDGDRMARAAQMVLVGTRLFVCLQDLPTNMLNPADQNGKVVVIDTETDEIVDVDPVTPGVQAIQLAGRNPSDITSSPQNERLYVANTGVYVMWVVDTTDGNGGIESIRLSDYTSEGIIVDDANLGGGVNLVKLASPTLALTITDGLHVASFNPATHSVLDTDVYSTVGFFLPEIAVDEQERLWVTEQNAGAPGMVLLDPSDGTVIAGPTAVGAPPGSITFVDL